jgi:hypothetical protein
MPTYPIQLKRNGTAAATPSSLLHGEVALNYADGKLFWKDASNVIQSFTFQAYALSSHAHGNVTSAGAIGSTANLPIITTTSGVLTTGSFGTTANTFCQGNDSRLSDTRTPTDGTVTTAKIANSAVTYAKIQNVSATDKLLGRSSANAGVVEEITCTSFARSILDDASAADVRSTLSVQPTASPAFTGTVSAAAASFTGTVTVTSPLVLTGTVAGNVRQIKMQTSGVDRWQITPSFDAESGSDAGSNFQITRWSDAGSFMGTPLYITRSTGIVNCESGLIVVSGNVGIGTSSPGVKLDVSGVGRIGNGVSQGNPSSTDIKATAHTLLSGTGGNYLAFGQYGSGSNYAAWMQSSFDNPSTATYNLVLQPLGGNVGIGTSSPTISSGVGLHVSGSTLRLGTARTPASASATGNTGEICWDASYLYICTGVNTWRRIAHSSW